MNMPLMVSDEQLQSAGMTADEALLELACRLFQLGRLSLWPAAQLAGRSRIEMEAALSERGIPVYVVTEEDLRQDLETMNRWSKNR
jgi:predicted HTH domain antitoxin